MQLLQQCCRVGVKGVIWEQAARYGMIVQRWIACALVRRELCSLRSQTRGRELRLPPRVTILRAEGFKSQKLLGSGFPPK